MGEYAEAHLDGTVCEACGAMLAGQGDGIPRYCSRQCARDRGRDDVFACDDGRPAKRSRRRVAR